MRLGIRIRQNLQDLVPEFTQGKLYRKCRQEKYRRNVHKKTKGKVREDKVLLEEDFLSIFHRNKKSER